MVVNISDLLSNLDKDPDQLLQEWRENAEHVKTFFLQEDLQKRRTENPHLFADYLKDVFLATALFMDDAMNEKLTAIDLPQTISRWFISVEDILSELEKIDKTGAACLPKTKALVFIKNHIDMNWYAELQIAYGYTATVNKKGHTPITKALIHSIYRNRNKETKQFGRARNEQEKQVMNWIIALEQASGMPALLKKSMMQVSEGNTKKLMLRSIIDSDEVHARTNKFYRSFYALFKLINPHTYFMTKEEFESQSEIISNGYQVYQAKFIKGLIR